MLSGSCSILFSGRKEGTLPPQALSFTGWPTGEQCSQHNLTADVCPGTICTNVKLIHCHLLSSAARTLGMTLIINILVQTLIKPATNYRGLVQLAAAVSSVTEQLSCLVNDITSLGIEIAVG